MATWPAQLAPRGDERAPRRRLGDVEAAVAGEERGGLRVDGRRRRVHEQHRHLDAVGRRVAHLADRRGLDRRAGQGRQLDRLATGTPGGDGVRPGERGVGDRHEVRVAVMAGERR